jgi:hypothetical protein
MTDSPRIRDWLLAVALLLVMMQFVPMFAGFV